MPDPSMPSGPSGGNPSNPQSGINASIEQQQLNNFLGPVNGALGGLPVAEKNQSYFAIFTGAGGTGPEIINQTALFTTYLVDENGNVSKPSEDYDSLNNLMQNFEVGKNVVVRNDAPTALNGNIAGIHLTTAVGRQQPILYTQTGSSEGANVDEIYFNSSLNQIDTPRMEGKLNKGIYNPTNFNWNYIENWNPVISAPDAVAASFLPTPGTYAVDSSGIGNINFIKFKVTIGIELAANAGVQARNVYLRITRNGITVGNEKTYTIQAENSTESQVFGFASDPLVYQELYTELNDPGDQDPDYKIQIKFDDFDYLKTTYTNFIVSTQNPQPSAPTASPPFWFNDSGNSLWLTGSNELSTNYGLIPSPIQECLDFNFSPIETPLNIQVGDRIRFEYNPDTEYRIYGVIEPSADNQGLLKLRLNTLVPSGVNLNNFVLHRVNTNDPAYVILDVTKNNLVGNTQNFNGVILPEYPTKRLKDNLDNIIIDLKSRGIITDNEN